MKGKVLFFFFSSRRRHTRLQGDWSSDVCSSDLHREEIPDHRELTSRETPTMQIRQITRSEEHTSELQSPCNLVCRLLLEKKKQSHILPHRKHHFHVGLPQLPPELRSQIQYQRTA